ncbi:hypothetical protein AVEN_16006-1, partial [Araneus ventricosus]
MLPGTRARELMESYPLTSDNYQKSVSALKDRFGKKELLTEIYVRELLKSIMSNVLSHGKDRLSLSKLFDKIESHLRSLESMGMDQEKNAAWLYPMVESCLSTDILRAWQRSPQFNKDDKEDETQSRLSNLLEFLRKEVENEEKVKLVRNTFGTPFVPREERGGGAKPKAGKGSIPTAAGLLTAKGHKCAFCGKAHESKECLIARSLSLQERVNKLKEGKCCLKCLSPGHFAKGCKAFIRCILCGKSHPVILCPDLPAKKEPESQGQELVSVQSNLSKPSCMSEVVFMTLIVEISNGVSKRKVRCLLDSGSQRSYILKSTAEALNLKSTSSENIAHTLFGGATTDARCHKKYSVKLSPLGKGTLFEFDFLEQEVICGNMPRLPKEQILKELKRHKIWISDLGDGCPKVEMLLVSDVYSKVITGGVKQLKGGLTAVNTKLETIGITDDGRSLTKEIEDELAREQFLSYLSRNEEGRYSVGLPWTQKQPPEIPTNRHVAETRLFSVTRKLRNLRKYHAYDQIFRDWLDEGIIEKVPENDLYKRSHYLPHHPVFKPESLTTQIRPVFDASSKTGRAPSLNDCLFSGPNLIEQIPLVLLRFREIAIGVTSDIKRAFLQIELREPDRDFLRFLWWENEKIQEFRHNRVAFGVTCSPYLFAAVLGYHLSHVPKELKEMANKLQKALYVDNCVTSVSDNNALNEFIVQSTNVLAEANMNLRMWCWGPFEATNQDVTCNVNIEQDLNPVIPVLGLKWDRTDDTLVITPKLEAKLESPTKRKILSLTQGIFDPLGFLAPALLPAKLLVQQAWATKSDWDTPLPTDIQSKYMQWLDELKELSKIKIPRRLGYGSPDHWTLHVFCDASLDAYAAVIFLRSDNQGEIILRFVGSKSRVSPLKRLTIPRLELLACLLGARFAKYTVEALDIPLKALTFWSDSTTAISWIQRNDKWGTFVGNRVKEILSITESSQWSYIPGKLNPADLASRGCTPQQLLRSRWWEGPAFLKAPPESWPNCEFIADEASVNSELK